MISWSGSVLTETSHGWWLCYDANEALLQAYPQSCLAHHLGVSVSAVSDAMASSGLIGRGVKAAKRSQLLGGVHMITSGQTSLMSSHFNFLLLGSTEPTHSMQEQLAGSAGVPLRL